MLKFAIVLAGFIVAATTATASPFRPTIWNGPRVVKPGWIVSYAVRGFPPGRRLSVVLSPTLNRGGNCCGRRVELWSPAWTSRTGRAVVLFRWPTHYRRCEGAPSCAWVRWRHSERVDLNISAVNVGVGTRRVVIVR